MNLQRALREKQRLIWPLALVLVANAVVFAIVVYPLSTKVSLGEQEADAATAALNVARRDYANARATVTGKAQADTELKKFYSDVMPPDLSGARRVTYLPGELRLYDNMTGRQFLRFISGLRGQRLDGEADLLARQFDIDLQRAIRHLSSGMKRKLALLSVLLPRVPLLILDEPTNTLDPTMRDEFLAQVMHARHQGQAVLFSSRASLVITASGVFRAWARLPTCVRARSTMSWFDWIRALSSSRSGSISAGR